MRRLARGILLVVSILNGVAGLVCGVLFIAGPDGHLLQAGALLPVIQGLPLASVFFQDFVWIGVAMLLVLGVPNSIAAVMLLRKSENQYRATLVAAVLLILWCAFELVFMLNALAVGYFAIGLISVLCSILLLRPAPASAQQVHRAERQKAD
jgi:EamA domain-containing membrane protein RarD